MTALLGGTIPWVVGAFAFVGVLVATYLTGHRKGYVAGSNAVEASTSRAATKTLADIARKDAAIDARAVQQKAAVDARVANPSAPTRSEVDAAMEREEARMRGGR